MTDDPYKDVSRLGQITSLTSDEDGGYPDVGLIVGLGDGVSLYIGELSAKTIGLDEQPGRWHIALHTDGKGFQIAGVVSDEFNARELVDHVFSAIQAAKAEALPTPSQMGAEVEKLAEQLRGAVTASGGIDLRDPELLLSAAATLERVERERQEDHQALLDAATAHETIAIRAEAAEAQVEALRKALESAGKLLDSFGPDDHNDAEFVRVRKAVRAALSASAAGAPSFTGWRAFSVYGVEGEYGSIYLSANGVVAHTSDNSPMGRALMQLEAIQREARKAENHQGILDSSTAAQAEESSDHPAEQDAHELTKALTGLVGGGSEMFVRKRGRFLADIPYCVERIRERLQRAERRALDETLRAKRYEKLLRKASDLILGINDRLENDGDRVFLGSTNDADTIHNLGHELQDIPATQAEARSAEPTLNEIRAAIEPYVRLAGGWVYSDAFTDSDDEMVTAVGIRLGAHRALVALSEALPAPPKAEANHGE